MLPAAIETFSTQQLAERARRIAEERPTAEGVKGVYWYKATRKWGAHIHYKAKEFYLGSFASLADAIERRLLAEKAVAEGKHPKPPEIGDPLLPAAIETFSTQQLAEHARRIAEERPTAEGVKGVYWQKATRKWLVYIRYKAKQINLGHFAALADAIERRLLAEKAVAEGRHPTPSLVADALLPAAVEPFSDRQLAEQLAAAKMPAGGPTFAAAYRALQMEQARRASTWVAAKPLNSRLFAACRRKDALDKRLAKPQRRSSRDR